SRTRATAKASAVATAATHSGTLPQATSPALARSTPHNAERAGREGDPQSGSALSIIPRRARRLREAGLGGLFRHAERFADDPPRDAGVAAGGHRRPQPGLGLDVRPVVGDDAGDERLAVRGQLGRSTRHPVKGSLTNLTGAST